MESLGKRSSAEIFDRIMFVSSKNIIHSSAAVYFRRVIEFFALFFSSSQRISFGDFFQPDFTVDPIAFRFAFIARTFLRKSKSGCFWNFKCQLCGKLKFDQIPLIEVTSKINNLGLITISLLRTLPTPYISATKQKINRHGLRQHKTEKKSTRNGKSTKCVLIVFFSGVLIIFKFSYSCTLECEGVKNA